MHFVHRGIVVRFQGPYLQDKVSISNVIDPKAEEEGSNFPLGSLAQTSEGGTVARALTPIDSGQPECTLSPLKRSLRFHSAVGRVCSWKNINEICRYGYAQTLIAKTEVTNAPEVVEEWIWGFQAGWHSGLTHVHGLSVNPPNLEIPGGHLLTVQSRANAYPF